MKTFEEYKKDFRDKVFRENFGTLSSLNLPYKSFGTVKLGNLLFKKKAVYRDFGSEFWIPVLLGNSDKTFLIYLTVEGKRLTVAITVDEITERLLEDTARIFGNNTKIISCEEIKMPDKESFLWIEKATSYTSLLGKNLCVSRGISSMSKAQIAGEILKKNRLVQYQLKFKGKRNVTD